MYRESGQNGVMRIEAGTRQGATVEKGRALRLFRLGRKRTVGYLSAALIMLSVTQQLITKCCATTKLT